MSLLMANHTDVSGQSDARNLKSLAFQPEGKVSADQISVTRTSPQLLVAWSVLC